MQTELLDTVYKVETPEAIDLSAQLVGPVPRILAFTIDLLIRALILLAASIIMLIMGLSGQGVFLIIYFLTDWFYPVIFEVKRQGQTPGKKSMHIAVVNDDLTPIGWSNSIIRNLLRTIDFLPLGYLFGILSICMSRHFQRLGDIAAGTLVIYRNEQNSHLHLPDVLAQPPGFPISLDAQVAFTGFVQRHEQLTQSRKEELAAILQDLTQLEGQPAVEKIQGIGCWLLGGSAHSKDVQ